MLLQMNRSRILYHWNHHPLMVTASSTFFLVVEWKTLNGSTWWICFEHIIWSYWSTSRWEQQNPVPTIIKNTKRIVIEEIKVFKSGTSITWEDQLWFEFASIIPITSCNKWCSIIHVWDNNWIDISRSVKFIWNCDRKWLRRSLIYIIVCFIIFIIIIILFIFLFFNGWKSPLHRISCSIHRKGRGTTDNYQGVRTLLLI